MFDDIRVGNDAGWHLAFTSQASPSPRQDCLSIGAGDYNADITASLPGGLEGGTYRFVVEGITDAHYRALHLASGLQVDLYLYWRDTVASPLGYLTSLAGLGDTVDALSGLPPDSARVARLSVTSVKRRVGARRYEAVIDARETVYESLSRTLRKPPPLSADLLKAALQIADAFAVQAKSHPPLVEPSPAAVKPVPAAAWTSGLSALAALDQALQDRHGLRGRGMLLIRDGVLHVGPGRIPLDGAKPKTLDDSGGLVHIESTGVAPGGTELAAPVVNRPYAMILKGRPDLKPGDLVGFVDPMADDATDLGEAASGLAAASNLPLGVDPPQAGKSGYVSGVSHRLSRTEGFVTTLAVVEVPPGHPWDESKPAAGNAPADADPAATPDGKMADAIGRLIGPPSQNLAVGEVRAATPKSSAEPPGQTVDLWLGLGAGDGQPFQARRLPVDRESRSRVGGVPYLTPFAWGKCGLVLPRYPGTRVLVGHHEGRVDDPVELGAVWPSGHGPDAQAGDWWLGLPAAVDTALRTSVDDGTTPDEPAGKASNDLIDADGARVIEVGRLTIRVLPTRLPAPGTRPEPPSDDAQHVTIEHESGSRIVISDNGDITIESAADMKIKVKKTLTLEADQVDVKVAKTMDVSGS